MDAKKKITQARVGMLLDNPFFGYLAMGLHLEEKDTLEPPTMATNGRKLYFHPEFIEKISLPELQGVIAHELGHCFLLHIPRRQNRVPERWNVAADYVVNGIVLKEFQLPKGILYDKQWEDKHAEYVYNHLPADKSGGGGGTLDSHAEWSEWGDGDNDKADGNGNDQNQNPLAGNGSSLEQQWRESVAQAANAARIQGKLPGHLEQLVSGVLHPKLDWRSILRDMITSTAKNDFRLIPPSKKQLYRGIYLPGITGNEIRIAAAIDTSGSISDQEMKEFLGEIKGICDSYTDYTIHLIACDAEVNKTWELHPMDDLPTTLPGRGGTDFRPAFTEADKHAHEITSFVYLTDLWGSFPDKEPSYETIWVAVSDQPVPFGKIIRYPRMNDEE